MKPLEHRRWFVLISFGLSLAMTAGLWQIAGLPWHWHGATVFLFATVGLMAAVVRLLALYLIRLRPALGAL